MFSITEIMILQFLSLVIVFNSNAIVNYIFQTLPFLTLRKINELIHHSYDFFTFICNHNTLMLDQYGFNDDTENISTIQKKIVQPIKYEDKYLETFKLFPNEFRFYDIFFEEENKEYEKIKTEQEKKRFELNNSVQENLTKINEILEKGDIHFEENEKWFYINEFGKNKLLEYSDMQNIAGEELYYVNYKDLYFELLRDKALLLKNMEEFEKNVLSDDVLRLKARDVIVDKHLDKFMDNYILEHTPLGNIFMRYNNYKKSFEYFSNNTIPYRYLESAGRRYAMTYWCKPIFVDIEEELKNAEVKYDLQKEEDDKKRQEEKNNYNSKNVVARLKSYNKETMSQAKMKPLMKNRSTNNILPPQIKANLPNVNQHLEKQLLKEHSNRYTWEGRLTDFCPLKKIDKKITNKRLMLSYADFKRMQQDDKNKKYV